MVGGCAMVSCSLFRSPPLESRLALLLVLFLLIGGGTYAPHHIRADEGITLEDEAGLSVTPLTTITMAIKPQTTADGINWRAQGARFSLLYPQIQVKSGQKKNTHDTTTTLLRPTSHRVTLSVDWSSLPRRIFEPAIAAAPDRTVRACAAH